MITVNSRKYDGSIRRSWQCEFIRQDDSLLVFVGEFETDVSHSEIGFIKKGTVSYEYFWLDRWYNIFRFHEPSGEVRNFYGNIAMPPKFEDGILDYVDLDIDVLATPGLELTVLDRVEYERNAELYSYTSEVRAKAEEALNELVELFESRNAPGLPELFATY
jgi:protein associated with RNAse G/E